MPIGPLPPHVGACLVHLPVRLARLGTAQTADACAVLGSPGVFGSKQAGLICVGLAVAGCAESRAGVADDDVAALLLRCKIGELEEAVLRGGLPDASARGEGECCAGAALAGCQCAWEVTALEPNEAALSDQLLELGGVFGTEGAPAPELEVAVDGLAARLEERARRVTVRVRCPAPAADDASTATRALEVSHMLVDARVPVASTAAPPTSTAADEVP
jgi:hypothetical protein